MQDLRKLVDAELLRARVEHAVECSKRDSSATLAPVVAGAYAGQIGDASAALAKALAAPAGVIYSRELGEVPPLAKFDTAAQSGSRKRPSGGTPAAQATAAEAATNPAAHRRAAPPDDGRAASLDALRALFAPDPRPLPETRGGRPV